MGRKLEIELTNMCLIYDDERILVQEKVGTRYQGGVVFREVMWKKENP